MTIPIRSWGAVLQPDGQTRFRIWAPIHKVVYVRLHDPPVDLAMLPQDDGWHELVTNLAPGSQYWYLLSDGTIVPDPATTFQPQDVTGPSEVTDPSKYRWECAAWTGRPWTEAVIYELHIGTFTVEGTFRAAIEKLPHLVALGITAIELMPIADFAGKRNWGYDGAMPYAPDSVYGRPEDLQALVDAAHTAGLMIFLDVVYNHFGPEGNYLSSSAPTFFTDRHETPWGAGINFDGESSEAVRRFFIDNALYWLHDFRFDGLRLDAVHAIADDSREHIIDAIAAAVHECFTHRHVHLILENEHNEAHRLARTNSHPVLYTAQWNDDVHHVLHTAATNERIGYYDEYCGDAHKLARAIATGFAFQGEVMRYRGSSRGEPSAHLPPTAFVAFIQNHDQIGNRAMGDRLTTLATQEAIRAVGAVYLLLPQIPMLFMGEEWGATEPFLFFCDFKGEVAQAVRIGRRDEFARFPEFAEPTSRDLIPDPNSAVTFDSAKLRWAEIDHARQRSTLDWYKVMLTIRHREIIPRLPLIQRGGDFDTLPSGALEVRWRVGAHETLILVANLTAQSASCMTTAGDYVLWQEGDWVDGMLSPWSVHWSVHTD